MLILAGIWMKISSDFAFSTAEWASGAGLEASCDGWT
jgi:hypothetical protein